MTAMSSVSGLLRASFRGGLRLEENKTASNDIRVLPAPEKVVLPLSQHIGAPAKPLVSIGDKVLRGQPIAEANGYVSTPVHASISGTVTAIDSFAVPHASGLTDQCIEITSDGNDESAIPLPPIDDPENADPQAIRDRIREAGIVGLGGAGFPSSVKLSPGSGSVVDTLILNGAECEPYISCDQALMTERAADIIQGGRVLMQAIDAQNCIIGIEDNKSAAIEALRQVINELADARIAVRVLPTKYPQGGEKQLIQAITGREVPSEGLPLDIGIVCQNVGTAAAVWRATKFGEVLTARIVTVTGNAVAQAANYEVRLGSIVADVIHAAGGFRSEPERLIMGGPMMGFALRSDDLPLVKVTNCLLAMAADDVAPSEPAMPCIRCGECAEACPASLLPQQMYWHARARQFDDARNYNLFDCIECGCCDQVCPSHIPLVQYFRFAKTEIWADERERRKADQARERHEFRNARLDRLAAEKEEARRKKREALEARKKKSAEKAAQETSAPVAEPATTEENQKHDAVAAAIAKAKAKKAAAEADSNDPPASASGEINDPVAAAIAKAKQKKLEKAQATDVASADADPVATAIEKVRKKKAAKQAAEQSQPTAATPSAGEPEDPVAAAIARAKQKKREKEQAEKDSDNG